MIMFMRRFQSVLPRASLLNIYKVIIKSHLECIDIIHAQAYSCYFHEKLESIKDNVSLTISSGTYTKTQT